MIMQTIAIVVWICFRCKEHRDWKRAQNALKQSDPVPKSPIIPITKEIFYEVDLNTEKEALIPEEEKSQAADFQ